MSRVIYKLDEKVFVLLKTNIEKINVIESGIHILTTIGKIFIYRKDLFDETTQLRVFIDKETTLHATYLFSTEYSKKVRNLLLQKYDEIDTSWIEEHAKIESYIKENEEVAEKLATDALIIALEDRISECNESGSERVTLYTTKRSDYNDKLSTNVGFGVNDLKPTSFTVYTHLLTKYGRKLLVNPVSLHNLEVEFIYVNN